ncbi:MAG: bifunctional diaminohydroxyphosphoribosylaminopyrimidine deaminase/5-amino-6-(5-phosphoribosylamino)uracil reductase RibD [Flavobacteriales bacterium]|nr:bifunctional diaminohydroxyphosphoribosylaminopyrimidine deaminase/5-amino-6-(5-phosphoribosylamino)uracil reductase RibD [Flavobacteriales bacterium]
MPIHETYMQRCLELAKMGLINAMPNPSVGSVITHKDKIIGEGYTSPFGGNHAEVNAINSVKNKELLSESTIYVSLEPCSHFGKTPPCSDLLIQHNFKQVVIGCVDPNPLVNLNGVQKLKDSGIEIITNVLEKECRASNKRFFAFQEQKRPYVILKWAQSSDGFIDSIRVSTDQNAAKITSQQSNTLVHKWRSEEMAIMIGTNTALLDNPSLTVRHVDGTNPTRIVIDKENKLPKSLAIFNNSAPTICYTTNHSHQENDNEWVRIDFKNSLKEILDDLHKRNILSLFVEGGQQLHQSFIEANLWDEARIFTNSTSLKDGVKAPTLGAEPISETTVGTDSLSMYKND